MMLAKTFRSVNSRLITVDNVIAEKVLKSVFAVSVFVYRNFGKNKDVKPAVVQIDNFDGSVKMMIDRSRSMGSAIYWTGFHEFREFLFLHKFLKPEMVVVDVGANQGEYALFSAKRVTKGKVIAFEPLPSILKVLYENIRLNNFTNIQVFPGGLSDVEGSLKIHEIEDEHEGLATIYPGERKSRSSFDIKLRTLDDVVREESVERIDFVKIDIEGGELKALVGSQQSIQKHKPVFMVEINEVTYRSAGYTVDDIDSFFKKNSYQAWSIGKGGRLLKCMKLPAFGNIVFKPQ